MAAGFPVKADYVTGDVLSAANMNDLAGTLNYLDPTAKGDLFPASSGTALTRLAIGANGTVLTADSAEATGMKWAASAAGGKVLQVVSTTKSDTFTSTATTYTDITGLSVTITPTSATSKILVLFNLSGGATEIANARLVRGSTPIAIGDAAGSRNRSAGDFAIFATPIVETLVSGSFLDSPATTSATTYKMQAQITSATFYINRSEGDTDNYYRARTASTITVMEIGA
jgi:hypothetical protein